MCSCTQMMHRVSVRSLTNSQTASPEDGGRADTALRLIHIFNQVGSSFMVRSTQRGFTLIELVVVIVILGILAAFAVPRFARLDQQARTASVRALEGTLGSSSALAHSLWLTAGSNPATVDMEGTSIAMVNGYPSRVGIANTLAGNIVDATTPGRYNTSNVGANGVEFRLNGSSNQATCYVRYTEAANASSQPTIVVDTAGCQ
jgi:MSHA pilin protein MshA